MAQCDGGLSMVRQPRLIPSVDAGSNPSPSLHFLEIDNDIATALVIEHHYMHRRCSISWAWGIKNDSGEVLGVLTVGKMQSWTVRASLVGEDYANAQTEPTARSNDVWE